MTRRLLILPLVALLAPVGVASAKTKTVAVKDDFFGVTALTVNKGTTVKWVWAGESPHNVNVTKGPKKFRSDIMESGTYSRKMKKRGTYSLVCTIHQPDMKMTLTVK